MPSLLDDLANLEQTLAQNDATASAVPILTLAEKLRESSPADDVNASSAAIGNICQRLYYQGRSIEALPLALSWHLQTKDIPDSEPALRAAIACGLLFADTGDFASSLDYQSFALKLTIEQSDPVGSSRVWNNIGLAFDESGSQTQAAAAFFRVIEHVEHISEPLFSRFIALTNLARHDQLNGRTDEGLRHANLAWNELLAGVPNADPFSQILLHRAFVRLHLNEGHVDNAKHHLALLAALAQQSGSVRARVALQTATAAVELATGKVEVALTRLEHALAESRKAQPTLRDTLTNLVRAEARVGTPGRALIRLRELSEILHQRSIGNAERHRNLAVWRPTDESHLPGFDCFIGTYLRPQLKLLEAPDDWSVLSNLAIGTTLQLDGNGAHGLRVGALTELLASAFGFPPLDALEIGCAAQLHDIGAACGHETLLPPHASKFDNDETGPRRHCEGGWQILADDLHPRLLMAREIARYHHAAWDGSGYPIGVAQLAIPIHARLCTVADTFDALLCEHASDPRYRMHDALTGIRDLSGSRLDPRLVRCFIDAIQQETRNEGIDLMAPEGLANIHQFIESLSHSRSYI